MKFALYFGNRGAFPAAVIADARNEMIEAVTKQGHEYVCLDPSQSRHGACEGIAEGKLYAKFLQENQDVDGAIICLPNFGDENAALEAFKDFKKPILIQAYTDGQDAMGIATRRDAFCGKFSIMDVFCQRGIKFSIFEPHTCDPLSKEFAAQISKFASVCNIVKGMKSFKIGAIGARVTAFKTVRYDEITLERAGATVETFDLAGVFSRVKAYPEDAKMEARKADMQAMMDCSNIPADQMTTMAKFAQVMVELCEEYALDTLAIRCWPEFGPDLGIRVCSIISYLNHIGIPTACELDVCNALAMQMLSLAAFMPAGCLDWNNNWGDDHNKCVLFHCGPIPPALMVDNGVVTDDIMAPSLQRGTFGINKSAMKPGVQTYASCKTVGGKVSVYFGVTECTEEVVPRESYGTCGVYKFGNLQDVLLHVGKFGYRHHVSVTMTDVVAALEEAGTNYLGYEMENMDKMYK